MAYSCAALNDRNSTLELGSLGAAFPAGGAYLAAMVELLAEIGRNGLASLRPEVVRHAQRRIAAEQARFLAAHDTPEGFYRGAFERLGVTLRDDELDPEVFLEHLVFGAGDLVQGAAQRLRRVSAPLRGGRIFYSSGTTDPTRRKRLHYDAVSLALMCEINRMGWGAATGSLTPGTQMLLLVPEQAKIAMPIAAFVADVMASARIRLFWGTRFVRPPRIVVDGELGVATAELQLKDNVRPNKAAVIGFNLACRFATGLHTITGFLPSIYALLRATGSQRGLARFLGHPRPGLILVGGGLKRLGIPPDVAAAGQTAVERYLDEVRDVTGVDPRELGATRSEGPPESQAALDELFTAFLTFRVEAMTGARCLNLYASTEAFSACYPAGSLRDLYGADYPRAPIGGARTDIFVPPPTMVFQLRDPVTDEIIPPTEAGRPGVARIWNPLVVPHLHAVETEDLLAWAPIPKGAPFDPAYAQGVGVRFCGRVSATTSAGYCAA